MAEEKDETSKNSSKNCIRTGLPAIKIDKFRGDYLKWREFRDMFVNIYHNNRNMPVSVKFYSLRELVVGDAKQEIACYAMGDDYEKAWTALNDRYEHPRFICEAHISQFMKIPDVDDTPSKHTQLFQLVADTRKLQQTLPSLGLAIDSWDVILIYMLERKLDTQTLSEWRLHSQNIHDKALAKLDDFLEFLRSRAIAIESLYRIEN